MNLSLKPMWQNFSFLLHFQRLITGQYFQHLEQGTVIYLYLELTQALYKIRDQYMFMTIAVMSHDLLLEASPHWHKSFVSVTEECGKPNTLVLSFFIFFTLTSGAFPISHPNITLTILFLCAKLSLRCILAQPLHQQVSCGFHLQSQKSQNEIRAAPGEIRNLRKPQTFISRLYLVC